MKIGFDISQTGGKKAGCGFFALGLIRQLVDIDKKNKYILYPTFGSHYWSQDLNDLFQVDLPNFRYGLKHKNIDQANHFWHEEPKKIELALGQPDILHSNNFFCPPRLPNTKLIYTLYDLSFLEYPDATLEQNRIICFDGIFKASLNADYIIAISNYSKNHFLKTFPHYPKDRIKVIYPGSRYTTIKDLIAKPTHVTNLVPQQFWLNVGTIEPRKNIKRLLCAYAELIKRQAKVYPLVLAGGPGWLEDDLEKFINDLGLKQHVHMLGYVNDDDLQWLYQNCFCLIYPSLFEGFGLPILEALNMGTPVITSKTSSMPEVAGSAAILINPLDEKDILDAMIEMSTNKDLQEQLKSLSIKQAEKFSWEQSANELIKLYSETINLPLKKPIKLKSNNTTKTALITGITGQDGSYLAELLLKNNYQIYGLRKNHPSTTRNNIKHIEKKIQLIDGDLTDSDTIYNAIKTIQPDEVYNLASQSYPGESWNNALKTAQVNGLGAQILFNTIKQLQPDCRIYQASSSEMFGDIVTTPQDEQTPFNPTNPYSAAKLYAHNIANIYRKSYSMFISCGVLFNHESPRRGMHFVTQKITYAAACLKLGIKNSFELNEKGDPIVKNGMLSLGNLETKRDWGFAGDYVEAMWLMLQQSNPDDFIIGTGQARSIKELCEIAFSYVGLHWENHITVDKRLVRPIETGHTLADASKAKNILGWEAKKSFETMITEMIDHHLDGFLKKIKYCEDKDIQCNKSL